MCLLLLACYIAKGIRIINRPRSKTSGSSVKFSCSWETSNSLFFFVVVAFHIFNGKNIKKNKNKKINGYKKAKDLERCYYSIHVEKSLRPARHAAKK